MPNVKRDGIGLQIPASENGLYSNAQHPVSRRPAPYDNMSGLEALGLVSNVFQVITFACDTVALCHAVYNARSSPDENLKEYATTLASLSIAVRKQCQQTQPKSQTERDLSDIAGKCTVAARALQDEVDFLTGHHAAGRLLATLQVAARTQWRKRRLARLEKSLEDYKKLFETHLLVRIWSVM